MLQDCILPVHGWTLPPGGGLRGGAPRPGETSAMANGTSGWGPPPASSVHSSGTGAWGSAPPPQNGPSAWGVTSNGIGNGPTPPVNMGGPGGDDIGPNNPKLLNSGPTGVGPVTAPGGGINQSQVLPNVMTPQQQQQQQPQLPPVSAVAPSAVGGNTSWAAAAGKGLPPQPEPTTNGAANKPIEVLNSLREALYSPVRQFSLT